MKSQICRSKWHFLWIECTQIKTESSAAEDCYPVCYTYLGLGSLSLQMKIRTRICNLWFLQMLSAPICVLLELRAEIFWNWNCETPVVTVTSPWNNLTVLRGCCCEFCWVDDLEDGRCQDVWACCGLGWGTSVRQLCGLCGTRACWVEGNTEHECASIEDRNKISPSSKRSGINFWN